METSHKTFPKIVWGRTFNIPNAGNKKFPNVIPTYDIIDVLTHKSLDETQEIWSVSFAIFSGHAPLDLIKEWSTKGKCCLRCISI